MQALGLELLGLSILAVKPKPETSRALEAETREALLRRADEATYSRRNAAVEQDRAIKENELATEVAVENKKRQVREAQMEAERSVQERRMRIEQEEVTGRIGLETQKKDLLTLASANSREEADTTRSLNVISVDTLKRRAPYKLEDVELPQPGKRGRPQKPE